MADRLRERGWLVPAYSMPPNREDLVIQRILIRHGFTREMAEELLKEMERAIEHLLNPQERAPREDASSPANNRSGR
jgi:glutamate decarboxylase